MSEDAQNHSEHIQSADAKIADLESKIVALERTIESANWAAEKTKYGLQALYRELEGKNRELNQLHQNKTQLLHTISHELRTPLAILKESASQISDGILGDVNAQQQKYLVLMAKQIDRLNRTIDKILEASRIASGQTVLNREEFCIQEILSPLSEAFQFQLKEKQIQMEIELEDEHLKVWADKDALTQVLTNLIANACKFTHSGRIEINVAGEESRVVISVADQGCGIASENIAKVFDPFQQFNRENGPGYRGTGLGLSICKGIVEAHRGRIHVESELGKGSCFTVSLPNKNV